MKKLGSDSKIIKEQNTKFQRKYEQQIHETTKVSCVTFREKKYNKKPKGKKIASRRRARHHAG